MLGKYLLNLNSDGQYVWSLEDAAGRRLLTGVPLASKAAALAAIDDCRLHSPNADRYQRARDKNGSAFFLLRTPGDDVIGRSDAFASAGLLEQAIVAVRAHGLGAVLDDHT